MLSWLCLNQPTPYVSAASFHYEDKTLFIFFPLSDSLTFLLVWKSLPFLQCLFFFFFMFQMLDPVARFLFDVEKFLLSPKFVPSSLFSLARWISAGQSAERKGFWRDFWRPRSSSRLFRWLFSCCWKACESNANEGSRSFYGGSVRPLWRSSSAQVFLHFWKMKNWCICSSVIRAAEEVVNT